MRFDYCKAKLHTACGEYKHDHCEMCNIARAYQHGCETAQEDMSKTGWIPVSERLPKENSRYLVQMSYGIMQVLSWANILEKVDDFDFYNKKHGGWYELDSEWGYCERHEVIAWMPLPKPYREENEAWR